VSVLSVTLSGAGAPLDVVYAGDAPGEILGVVQVNFRLPDQPPIDLPAGLYEFQLQVGAASSAPVGIYINP
jgi:uncharacterized protein (TIGR03437 family)